MFGVIAALLLVVFNLFQPGVLRVWFHPLATPTSSKTSRRVRLAALSSRGSVLTGTLQDRRAFQTYLPDDPTLISRLLGKKLRIAAALVEEQPSVPHLLLSWLPLLVLTGTWLWFTNRVARALRLMTHAVEVLFGALADREQQGTRSDAGPG